MTFIYACLAWLTIGTLLGLGIFLMVVHGSPWLFILFMLSFLIGVAKIGYCH